MTTAQAALERATTNASTSNYLPVIVGFIEKGIKPEDITPRVNVLTFNAWKAKGRQVQKGEKGVQIVTWIECTKKDGEKYMRPKTTTVFHISQTKEIKAD